MAPINVDVAEVEVQLCTIRRRRNGLAAQRALAGALSATLMAASLVVAAALRGGTGLFVLATALAAGGTAACVAYVMWHMWRDWLSLTATARLADSRAALNDRVTTLLAVAPLSPAPPLRSLLLDQVLHARQRWGVEALAPRRVSPWLALVPLAAAMFIATTFYARPPAAAAPRRLAGRTAAPPVAPVAGAATAPGSSQDLFSRPGDGAASRAGARETVEGATAPGEETTVADAQAHLTGAAAPLPVGAGALATLRQSIQRAFGAAPGAEERPHGTPADRTTRGGGGTAHEPQLSGSSPSTRTADARRDAATSPSLAPGTNAANRTASGARDSQGNGRGGAARGAATGVLGAAAAPRAADGTAAPVAIKLSAITGVSPRQTEPQRRHDVPAASARTSRTDGPLPPLADDQLADATVQPLAVGPEHEGLVRRIFTRE